MRRLHAFAIFTLAALLPAAPSLGQDEAAKPAETPKLEQILEGLKADSAVDRLAAAEAAKTNQDAKLMGPLGRLLKDDTFEVRMAAVQALGGRTAKGGRKKAAKTLGTRLKAVAKKRDFLAEELEVVKALHDLAQRGSIKALIGGIDTATTAEVEEARLMAVANVPHADAIDALITFMAKGRRGRKKQGSAAGKALRYATGERVRNEADEWRAWWKEARKTFDFEAAATKREEVAGKRREREERKGRREKGDRGGKGRKKKKGDEGEAE